jgi:glutamate N-acetyltransferase/amino-acid N-acetyltransferase
MIHPDLGVLLPGKEQVGAIPHATMLAFILTDAQVDAATLQQLLTSAVDSTFNCCSVDGDTSTNDTVIAMASGACPQPATLEALGAAITSACDELARSMARDGEGAEHLAEIRVSGLATDAEARQVARTVATSALVKTALFGQDANWGRLLAAAGRAGVPFRAEAAQIRIGGVTIVNAGLAVGAAAEAEAAKHLATESYLVELQLGDGPGKAHYYTCDFGHGYVDVNAGYRS